MRVGIRLPGAGRWAGPDAIAEVARQAEALGFDSLWMTDHIALPTTIESSYPYRQDGKFLWEPDTPYLDTLMVLSWAAAATQRVSIGTSVLILPWRPIVHTAKQLVSLDVLSKGRLILGVGVGWMREQFELLGASFEDRGARTTEAIELLRHMWRDREVDFSGRHFDLHGFMMYPKPVRPGGIPIWIGGAGPAALARVAKVGDGWNPLGVAPEEYARQKQMLVDLMAARGRSMDELTLTARPMHTVELNAETLEAYSDLGVTELICDTAFAHETLDAALDELRQLADTVLPVARRLPRDRSIPP